jgi:hypothetical protein
MSHHEEGHDRNRPVAVAVITPSGTFPNDYDYRRAFSHERVEEVLKLAKAHLELTDTTDWEATVDNQPIDPQKAFEDIGLEQIVEIRWNMKEGGGGA